MFLETSENEFSTVQNLWDTRKAVLRGKFKVIDTGLPKKNRNISNKQPNPTPTRTWEQQQRQPRAKYKVGNNQGQSRIK